MVQHPRLVGRRFHVPIEGLDIFEDRRVLLAGVLEAQHPVGRRVSLIDHYVARHAQAGLGIGPGDVMLRLGGQVFLLSRVLPVPEKLVRRLAAIRERERRLLLPLPPERAAHTVGHRGHFARCSHKRVLGGIGRDVGNVQGEDEILQRPQRND